MSLGSTRVRPGTRPRSLFVALAVMTVALASPTVLAQSWRGAARLDGTVHDDRNQPLVGVEVTLHWLEIESREGPSSTTDARGRWSAIDLAPGWWSVEVVADGFYPGEGRALIVADQPTKPMEFRLRPLTEELPRFTEGNAGTIRAWIDKGDALMLQEQWAQARAEYQKAMEALPSSEHAQLLQAIARTQFMEGDVDQSVTSMERALRMAPKDDELARIYRLLMDQIGRTAAANSFLTELPDAPDPEAVGLPDTDHDPQVPPEIQRLLDAPAEAPVAGRTGTFKVGFERRSPLSSLDEYARRMSIDAETLRTSDPDAMAYAIGDESYDVFVPPTYEPENGWGLLVYVSPTAYGGVGREETRRALAAHELIWIGANHAGNPRLKWDRSGLALDAVANMSELYDLDPRRIYVGGYSGGGRLASALAMLYSEVFRGGISLFGVDYFRPVGVPDHPGHSWPPSFAAPEPGVLDRVRRESRFVIVTGDRDFNRQQSRAVSETMDRDGFEGVTYVEIPGANHYAGISGEWLEQALSALDGD